MNSSIGCWIGATTFWRKGFPTVRAETLARQVLRWDEYRQDVWLAEVNPPTDYGRPTRCFVKRQLKDGQVSSQLLPLHPVRPSKTCYLHLYDDRGAAEIEQFRGDKSGLGLEARRKHSFPGQQGYILLTDLAHNLLSEFSQQALADSPFADFGPKRIIRDLFAIPGRLFFDQDRLARGRVAKSKAIFQGVGIVLVKVLFRRLNPN